ncbi:hypothetical protein BJ508DRAFT_344495 [Ascobolus immersus RN42]|uniref:Uncharacterized protein n=1 Tax=Ascobolus immersus RN42 TaxID=1160509 RepID=A0A3N4IDS5_ASCIM|nr:hypothetical protein BJ508DRAFT_344495 [Ascobolus immersus RN42]
MGTSTGRKVLAFFHLPNPRRQLQATYTPSASNFSVYNEQIQALDEDIEQLKTRAHENKEKLEEAEEVIRQREVREEIREEIRELQKKLVRSRQGSKEKLISVEEAMPLLEEIELRKKKLKCVIRGENFDESGPSEKRITDMTMVIYKSSVGDRPLSLNSRRGVPQNQTH